MIRAGPEQESRPPRASVTPSDRLYARGDRSLEVLRSKQSQLAACIRRATKSILPHVTVTFVAVEAEAMASLVEQALDGLKYFAFAAHARAEARVVQLAATHLAGAAQHFFGGEREAGLEPLGEHVFHGA